MAAGAGLAASRCYSLLSLQHAIRNFSGQYDVILRNGIIVDGSGGPSFTADLGIQDDEISAIGDLSEAHGAVVYDCSGLHVCPGFVDLHSHSDYVLFKDARAFSKIYQGVTTEIVGQDGRSAGPFLPGLAKAMHAQIQSSNGRVPYWTTIAGYYDALDDKGIALNVKTMVGSGTLRQNLAGYDRRELTRKEIAKARDMLAEGLADGAAGVSSGLEYLPNALSTTEELIQLCKGAGLYTTHMRNEDDDVLAAMIEAIRIAREADVDLNISHFKLQGQRNWGQIKNAFIVIEQARQSGLRVTMDRYPYLAYHTALNSMFPVWAQKKGINSSLLRGRNGEILRKQVLDKVSGIGGFDRIRLGVVYSSKYKKYSGKDLLTISRSVGRPPYELMIDICATGSSSTVVFAMSDENLMRIYKDPFASVASDGSALHPNMKGHPHPRNYGTFPRFLSHYVLEKGVLSFEEGIRRCSALPASVAGLHRRGMLREGWKADICILSQKNIGSFATYDEPLRLPSGVDGLIVNGRFVMRNGYFTGTFGGKALREER